jgi:hypothetical protein
MLNSGKIASDITFEDAIAAAQSLLNQRAQAVIEDAEFGAATAQLTATQNGARGFFVTYLTDSRALVDILIPVVAAAIRDSTEVSPELLIKNLAMSTAMEITHHRNQNPEQAAQSAQVQKRTAALIDLLGFAYVKAEAEGLWQGIATQAGDYAAFLDRWGYDAEQKAAIAHTLQAACPEVTAMTS